MIINYSLKHSEEQTGEILGLAKDLPNGVICSRNDPHSHFIAMRFDDNYLLWSTNDQSHLIDKAVGWGFKKHISFPKGATICFTQD